MQILKTTITVLTCLSMAGCGSIGTINGVELAGPRMGATDSGPQPYCDQNDQQRWVCILVAAGIVGGITAIAASHGGHNTSAPPPSPPPLT